MGLLVSDGALAGIYFCLYFGDSEDKNRSSEKLRSFLISNPKQGRSGVQPLWGFSQKVPQDVAFLPCLLPMETTEDVEIYSLFCQLRGEIPGEYHHVFLVFGAQ